MKYQITESDLIDNLNHDAVTEIMIYEQEDKQFRVYIGLNWKPGWMLLETQRKKTRTWVGLNRLIDHINEKWVISGQLTPPIRLRLRSHPSCLEMQESEQQS